MKSKIKNVMILSIFLGFLSLTIVSFCSCSSDSKVDLPKENKQISKVPKIKETIARLTFGGDVLLHTNTFEACKISENKYDFNPVFELVKPYFYADFKILNMEGIVDAYGNNRDLSGYPCFNAPLEIAQAIKNLSVNMVVTANNHAFDKRYSGLENNLKNLHALGLQTIGTYTDRQAFEEAKIVEVNGIKIGVSAYTDSVNGLECVIPEEKSTFAIKKFSSSDLSYLDKIYKDIDKLKAKGADVIVISLHWGAEYQDEPSQIQVKIAESLADYGADIIMGNHSHCVQPVKLRTVTRGNMKRNALIIYSLGNFFADQSFTDQYYNQKTKRSMLVNVTIKKTCDSEINLENMSYLPTYLLKDPKYAFPGSKYGYRIISSGKYSALNNRPDVFSTDILWENCKRAFEHVKKIAGNDIECVT